MVKNCVLDHYKALGGGGGGYLDLRGLTTKNNTLCVFPTERCTKKIDFFGELSPKT